MIQSKVIHLQGRLHPSIRDPTAVELTHHLCPPLAFLVDACLDLFDEPVQVNYIILAIYKHQ